MIHPLLVNVAEQHDALKLAHSLGSVLSLLRRVDSLGALDQHIGDIGLLHAVEFVNGVGQVVGHCQNARVMLAEPGDIPVVGDVSLTEHIHVLLYALAYHRLDAVADIVAVKHLRALGVDSHSLL